MSGETIRRRDILTLLGGAAASSMWPLAGRAQQQAMPVVGLLTGIDLDDRQFGAVRQGLGELGYIVGQNVVIEARSAGGQYDRLPELAADLVRRRVAVIAAMQGTGAALAAKAATATIPIVFSVGTDPVAAGLVTSFNRPGGNLTGVTILANTLAAKRFGLLHELTPGTSLIGNLVNRTNPNSEAETKEVEAAAGTLRRQLHIVNASTEREIEAAFADFRRQRVGALLVSADAFYYSRRDQIVALAARHALPTMYFLRDFAAAGGLMSYGTSLTDAFRQVGAYAGRVLKGEKPSDLPVMQPTRFEFVINLQTVRTLGLTVPPGLLAIADEVIE